MSERSAAATAIIGIGNLLRGDDGIGIQIARRLREANLLGVEIFESRGDVTDLLEIFGRFSSVHLIDAVHMEGGEHEASGPAKVVRLDLLKENGPDLDPASSSHVLGIGESVALAKLLNRLPAKLEFWGIESQRFDLGSEPSPSVREGAEDLIRSLVEKIREEKSHA
jgi:hydrogenase maturation protease